MENNFIENIKRFESKIFEFKPFIFSEFVINAIFLLLKSKSLNPF